MSSNAERTNNLPVRIHAFVLYFRRGSVMVAVGPDGEGGRVMLRAVPKAARRRAERDSR